MSAAVSRTEEYVLAYATPGDEHAPPKPPLHFWVRLVLFGLLAGAFAWPVIRHAWGGL